MKSSRATRIVTWCCILGAIAAGFTAWYRLRRGGAAAVHLSGAWGGGHAPGIGARGNAPTTYNGGASNLTDVAGLSGGNQGRALPEIHAALRAAALWRKLADEIAASKEEPTRDRILKVKEWFDRMTDADRLDNIRYALNLLPDMQIPCLYGILFDKSERPEVLDAIFSDVLNRPDEIKVPIMLVLAGDKEHPMYFESVRILDATGELPFRPATNQPPVAGGTEE